MDRKDDDFSLEVTPAERILDIVEAVNAGFRSGKTKELEFRKRQLLGIIDMMKENQEQLVKAVHEDMRKPHEETIGTEIAILINEAAYLYDNLEELARTTTFWPDLANALDGKLMVRKEPKGTVLIIGAWNYPIQLILLPLCGAIAAGCTVVLKPSEISAHTAQLISQLLPKYLDPECYACINGGVRETTALLSQKWAHIFYTGNGTVGRIVMSAAAKHLVPTTLELGGKSPAIISDNSDIEVVASRILWTKVLNAGQTCVAVDYILCSEAVKEKLLVVFKKKIDEWYQGNVKNSSDYTRIVNQRHFSRLVGMLKSTSGKIAIGGDYDESDLYISPTVVVNPDELDNLLVDEIFGPILPIRTVANLEEAVQWVNSRDHPLALYIFSKKSSEYEYVLENTMSGGVLVNDAILHLTCMNLPFGGVGESGMGSYHGKKSFEAFTHERSVLVKGQRMEFLNRILRYPPYSRRKMNMLVNILFQSGPSKLVNLLKLPWRIILTLALISVLLLKNLKRHH